METARVPAASCEEAIGRWEDMCKEVQLLNHKLQERVKCAAFGIHGVPVEPKKLELKAQMNVTRLKAADLFSQIEEQSEEPKSESNTLELETLMNVTSQKAAELLPHVETERVPAVSYEEAIDRWDVMCKEVQLLNHKLEDRVKCTAFGIHGVPVESKTLELKALMNLTSKKAAVLFSQIEEQFWEEEPRSE